MSENLINTSDAVKGIVEAVPIYEDLLQPAVQELGKGLHTLSKTIHIALAPVSALVWSYDQIRDFTISTLEEKLKNIPKENIIPPDPSVAGPALEALRYTGNKEELREMFSNLLATAMNSEVAPIAHPSFVEIIKQLNPDEAKILSLMNTHISKPIIKIRASNKDTDHYAEPLINFSMLPYLAKCNYPEQGPSYLENIARLGLAEIEYSTYNTLLNSYDSLESHIFVTELISAIKLLDKRVEIKRGTFNRTSFGKKFYESCILTK